MARRVRPSALSLQRSEESIAEMSHTTVHWKEWVDSRYIGVAMETGDWDGVATCVFQCLHDTRALSWMGFIGVKSSSLTLFCLDNVTWHKPTIAWADPSSIKEAVWVDVHDDSENKHASMLDVLRDALLVNDIRGWEAAVFEMIVADFQPKLCGKV